MKSIFIFFFLLFFHFLATFLSISIDISKWIYHIFINLYLRHKKKMVNREMIFRFSIIIFFLSATSKNMMYRYSLLFLSPLVSAAIGYQLQRRQNPKAPSDLYPPYISCLQYYFLSVKPSHSRWYQQILTSFFFFLMTNLSVFFPYVS